MYCAHKLLSRDHADLRLVYVFTYCFKWWNYLEHRTEVRVTEASYIDLFVVLLLMSCVLSFTYITLSYKKKGEDAMRRENEEYTPCPPACRVTRTPCGMLYFDIFINISYY